MYNANRMDTNVIYWGDNLAVVHSELTSGEWFQAGTLFVLTITLGAVLWYAREAWKQARATQRIADAGLRPIIVHWVDETSVSSSTVEVLYRNIGNGPALSVRWWLEGNEPNEPNHTVIALEHEHEKSSADPDSNWFVVPEKRPFVMMCEYEDIHGNSWLSTLEIVERGGMLSHGVASIASTG